MTFEEAYTSLKNLYRKMMFPENLHAQKWTMAELDQLDVHFFSELMDSEEESEPEKQYINDVF